MQAFLVLLRYDLGQMGRSWIVRLWIALLAIPALFVVAVAANEKELASETLGAYVAAVLAPLSWLAVSIFAASAVAGEAAVIADSILSKSVTRTEYLSAKIVARVGTTVFVSLAILAPFAFLLSRYAVSDVSVTGVTLGLLMVAALLAFLASLGIALSTVFKNVQLAVLCVLVAVLLSGLAFQFLGVTWMSTTAVLEQLPETFRGQTASWLAFRVLGVFVALSAAAVVASLMIFRRKDL